MTEENFTLPTEILEQLMASGMNYMPELLGVLLNTAMQVERQRHLGVGPYERSDDRNGYANGYKPKTLTTRIGKVHLDVPQVRDSSFYPEALEKGLRSERALTMTLAQMYVQGVSTRKVKTIVEELCGTSISSTQVSRATAQLDKSLAEWRNRQLGEIKYLYLDARYEKVREDGQIRDAAVLMAAGVDQSGKRQVIGVSASLGEHELHWRAFLQTLVERGLCGVQLIISDAHAGLRAARQTVFGAVPWQRCQFHLQQNAQAYVTRKSMRAELAADIRHIFSAPDKVTAITWLNDVVKKYQTNASKLATWLEENIPEGLTVFSYPVDHWRKIRTVNLLERLSQEIRRRTRVIRIFPNEEACLRLVSAVLIEISEDWQTGRTYLNMDISEMDKT